MLPKIVYDATLLACGFFAGQGNLTACLLFGALHGVVFLVILATTTTTRNERDQ